MVPYRTSSPHLVGRREELHALREAFERASEGEPSTVLVAGEAGIGKTRMIREFAAHLGSPAHVMYGTCVPLADTGLPYGPVRDALRSFVRVSDAATLEHLKAVATSELSSIVPELSDPSVRSTAPPESGFAQLRMFELVLNLLEHLADEQPVMLALEDLHWADGSTLALVAFLIRHLADARVLVCATYRDDELHRRHRSSMPTEDPGKDLPPPRRFVEGRRAWGTRVDQLRSAPVRTAIVAPANPLRHAAMNPAATEIRFPPPYRCRVYLPTMVP